jgi:hypothetical protein
MRFSWMGVFLAPLAVPLLFSTALVVTGLLGPNPGGGVGSAALGFLVLLVPGCIVSYGTTIFLFLPCLALLSRWARMTYVRVCLLGLVLGAAVIVPMTWLEWGASGPDSGPPVESFGTFFLRWIADPSFWLEGFFPLAGLITAGFYWWLAARRPGRSDPAGG